MSSTKQLVQTCSRFFADNTWHCLTISRGTIYIYHYDNAASIQCTNSPPSCSFCCTITKVYRLQEIVASKTTSHLILWSWDHISTHTSSVVLKLLQLGKTPLLWIIQIPCYTLSISHKKSHNYYKRWLPLIFLVFFCSLSYPYPHLPPSLPCHQPFPTTVKKLASLHLIPFYLECAHLYPQEKDNVVYQRDWELLAG